MKTEPASVMSLDDGPPSSSSSPTNDSLPPSVVHVSRDELRKFLKCKRVGNYLLGKTIGEGSFAKVKQGFHVLTGEKVAVKIIDKKQAMEDRYVSKNMRREAKILQMVRHPNVIHLLEVVETENRYYLVFEIAGGGDLMDYICYRKKLGEIEVRKFIRQTISAVHYLHQGGIIHRDLKVENLLLDENYNIKIIDFGLSNTVNVPMSGERSSSRDHCKTQCGSPAYAAPEILGHLTYGTKVDVWSIGVNMYAMLTGKLPYTAEPFNIITLYNKMVKGDMNPVPDRLSPGCKDLMLRFLTFDPTERISIEEAIKHPWLHKGFEDTPLLQLHFPCYLRPDELNSDILNHMVDRMQFKAKDIIEGVTCNKANAASCVYHLINRKLQRYLDKLPKTRMLRRVKSRDDEIDAVPKKQRIDIDADSSNRMLERSRSITSQQLRSGASSSQDSRGIRIGIGSGTSSQGSRGPRGRLASDRDGTELKGSAIIPNASDHYLAIPKNDVQTSGAFNQLSIEIDDDEIEGEIEGHDVGNRKVSITYDFTSERKHSRADYHPSPLAIREHQPTTHIIDDNNNDNDVTGENADNVFVSDNDVTGVNDAGGGRGEKDVGMAPTMSDTVAKVVPVPVSPPLESLMEPEETVKPKRKSSLPSPRQRTDNTDISPVTRSRRGSLPSRTYPVTRDPSPIRKPRQPSEPVTSPSNAMVSKGSFGLVCQVTAVDKEKNNDSSESAQLMLRSTLSPLSVHCSPKPTRRYSTPVNPTKDFYNEVLGINGDKASSRDSPEGRTTSQENVKGTRSQSRPFGSPVISRRLSTSSTSSDDRTTKRNKIPFPLTPREPLLPNLGLKLLTKHPPIEPISLAPLTTRKLSLDSKTGNEKAKDRKLRRRNTIMNPPLHGKHDTGGARDGNKESRDSESRVQGVNKSIDLDSRLNGTSGVDKETLEVPCDESRDSDSSNSSIGNPTGSSKVRARVTIKERRQTTELDMRTDRHANEVHCEIITDEITLDKTLRDKTSESRDGLRDKTNQVSAKQSRNGGKVKTRVTIKERRQTTELDTRAGRNTNRIQFKITDTHEPTRDSPKRLERVDELKTTERRSSVPEKSRDKYREQNGVLVRRSSVPALNKENSINQITNQVSKTKPLISRTMSETNAMDLERLAGDGLYDNNPWLKHEKTIQRSIAMRAETANRRAEGGRNRPSKERARRHTVSTSSPITTTTKHKVMSSPRTLKKSLV